MFFGNLKGIDKLPNRFQTSKDSVLSSKRIFTKEDLESGLALVLATAEIGIGAGELVEIVGKDVNVVNRFFFHQ
jgi:hypothetical protein